MGAGEATVTAKSTDDARNCVLARYDELIKYYWKSSKSNKRSYKTTRYVVTILGATVTLVSSLSAARFVKGGLALAFEVGTPFLAASMAIVSGVSQAFQWGAAWSDMAITAARLEKERDRVMVTPGAQMDPVKEMALLDDMVLAETQGFFQRLFGTGGPVKSEPKASPGSPE